MLPLLLLLLLVQTPSSSSTIFIKGISPQNRHRYEVAIVGPDFTCLDGSATVTVSAVNDDYCDCADGSDEPGTSACNNGKFYCANDGHVGKEIPSSFVADGVCDCCDGSDESARPDSTCADTCAELGAKARAEAEAALERFTSGAVKRRALVAAAAEDLGKVRSDLAEAQATLAAAKESLAAVEPVAEVASTRAKLAKRVLDEAERAAEDAELDAELDAPLDCDTTVYPDEDEGAAEEEEGEEGVEAVDPVDEVAQQEGVEELHDEVFEAGAKDTATLEAYIAASEELNEARDEAAEAVSDAEEEVSTLKATLSTSYGLDDAFFPLKGQCFTLDTRDYQYELCPFRSAKQKPSGGGGVGTSLGSWEESSWENPGEWQFRNGQSCWQGPKRSATVTLRCGPDNQLLDVDEPAKCTYTFVLETPAACDEATVAAERARLFAVAGVRSPATEGAVHTEL